MVRPKGRRDRFLFSLEEELLTVPEGLSLRQFFAAGRRQAPSLSGPGDGFHNTYGRVYLDAGHVELAAAELDDPYQLSTVVETQHLLVAKAVEEVEKVPGHRLLLANNNHSGLLQRGCPVWGTHANHLTEQHPSEFTSRILPFLVTQTFAGAGAVLFPDGSFLAGSRPVCMELTTGGSTTSDRAIHSTAREEHHMGPSNTCYRYHQLLGCGHRSHFNRALYCGAMALALKAAIFDEQLPRELEDLPGMPPPNKNWVGLLQRINVLAAPGQPLVIDPLVVKTQRVYLEAARRFATTLDRVPPWIPRLLGDWQQTLDAMQETDLAWLSSRLDSFIKYKLYSNVLEQSGTTWARLPDNPEMFSRLALLDHSYHEFCNAQSVFRRLDEAGVLAHRVGQDPNPGGEPEPFVIETSTRARTRARFIAKHAGDNKFIVDWSRVIDNEKNMQADLFDPFAQEYGPWRESLEGCAPMSRRTSRVSMMAAQLHEAYDQGEFQTAAVIQQTLLANRSVLTGELRRSVLRGSAWSRARSGFTDGAQFLNELHDGHLTLTALTDYAAVYRFQGLQPAPEIAEILEGAREWLAGGAVDNPHGDAPALREHAACYHLAGENEQSQALNLLRGFLPVRVQSEIQSRIAGRIFCTAAECFRRQGKRQRASRLLQRGEEIFVANGHRGELCEFALNGRAKLVRSRRKALQYLDRARSIEERLGHRMALVRTLLLEARLTNDAARVGVIHRQVTELRDELPALAACRLLSRILGHWCEWTGGSRKRDIDTEDDFWGL